MKAEGLEPDTAHVPDSWIDHVKTKVPGVNYVGGRAYLIVSEHSCRAGHRPRSRR